MELYKENLNRIIKSKLIEICRNNKYEGIIYKYLQYIKILLPNENKRKKKDKILEQSINLKEEYNKNNNGQKQLTLNKFSSSNEFKSNNNNCLSLIQNLNKIANIFGYKYDELFLFYLKKISKPNKFFCHKLILKGVGGWKCLDCDNSNNSLICDDCFNKSKRKHKEHKIEFYTDGFGFCDCGEENAIIKESFCPDHQGAFTNMKEIINFIKTSFDGLVLNKMDFFLNNIFKLLTEKIHFVLNMNYKNSNSNNDEYKNKEDELFNMINIFESFVSNLYDNNLALFSFVILKFTDNYPFETYHKCFYYDEEKNLIITKDENQAEKHICICPFFHIFILFLTIRKSVFNFDNFFKSFISNYKIRLIVCLSFMNSLIKLNLNKNLLSTKNQELWAFSDKLSEIFFEKQNFFFFENFLQEIYVKLKELLNLELYEQAFVIFTYIKGIIFYLPTFDNIDKIRNNLKIFSILIHIICLMNNLIAFEDKIQFNIYDTESLGFLLMSETFCLNIATSIAFLLDYNNLDNVKFIFNEIINKLCEYKNYKDSLKEKLFTPHIAYIRYYSIFLNRFCFNHSINNNCDLIDSFQYFQTLFPKTKELNVFLFKELITCFGFIISQEFYYFKYNDKAMNQYNEFYFGKKYTININCDITLMKYLLTISQIQQEFNIINILTYSNIDSCNDFFLNLFKIDLKKVDYLNLNLENEIANFLYINRLLEIFSIIIKNNKSMIYLAFNSSNKFRMKYGDILFNNLIRKEKKNFENILKNEILYHLFGNNKNIERESCEKIYNEFYMLNKDLSKDFVINILTENCRIISSSNELKKYSLKKKTLKYFDYDYIIDIFERILAIKLTIDSLDFGITPINTCAPNTLSIQEKLNCKIYENWFNKNNLENIISFCDFSIIIDDDNYTLTNIFILTYSKIICTYIKIFKGNINEEFRNKLTKILEKNDNVLFKYIKKLLSDEDNANKNRLETKKYFKNVSLKEYNNNIKKEIKKEDNSSPKIDEICIYCKKPLNKDDINNYYGKICFLVCDYFVDILKNEEQNLRKKTTRIVTCNHKIHFNCYSELEIKNINSNLIKDGFECPKCKILSNIMLCENSDFIQNNKSFLKGMIFEKENKNEFYFNFIGNIKNVQKIIIYNKSFFEIYSSKLLKKDIIINDINVDLNIFENLYNLLLNDFDSFTIYYTVTKYKQEQINIWKNILLTIRLLCKYKILDYFDFFISKFSSLCIKFKNLDFSNIDNCDISSIINQFIFCLFIIYDLNQETINKIFQNYILEYMFVYYWYINGNNNKIKLKEFLSKNNRILLKNIFDLYFSKYTICFLLYNGDKIINLDFTESIQFLKRKADKNYNLIINSTDKILKETQLGKILKFNIIELPKNFVEFNSKYMNINCVNCNEKNSNYLICLICGKKICNDKNCIYENKTRFENYSIINHSKESKCGNALFISNINSEIIFLLKKQIINSRIYIYLTLLGECLSNYNYNDSFFLNEEQLQKSINIFIDITFRKKDYKNYINSFDN